MSCHDVRRRAEHLHQGAARSADDDQRDQPGSPVTPATIGRRLPPLDGPGGKHGRGPFDAGGRWAAPASEPQALGQLIRGHVPGVEVQQRGSARPRGLPRFRALSPRPEPSAARIFIPGNRWPRVVENQLAVDTALEMLPSRHVSLVCLDQSPRTHPCAASLLPSTCHALLWNGR
jgi:hypothetical protein